MKIFNHKVKYILPIWLALVGCSYNQQLDRSPNSSLNNPKIIETLEENKTLEQKLEVSLTIKDLAGNALWPLVVEYNKTFYILERGGKLDLNLYKGKNKIIMHFSEYYFKLRKEVEIEVNSENNIEINTDFLSIESILRIIKLDAERDNRIPINTFEVEENKSEEIMN